MNNPKQNKNRKEYWAHKLRTEITYTSTQKCEKAINEYTEDIAQHIELILAEKNSSKEEIEDAVTKLSNKIDESHRITRKDITAWVLLTLGVVLGGILAQWIY